MTQLSRYFSLEEMTASQMAARKRIDNTPNAEQLENLLDTCRQMDRVRELLGYPVIVSSGFRSPKLNAAVNGSKTSSHMSGYAVDFTCPGYGSVEEVFEFLKKALPNAGVAYDQLIHEFPDSPGSWCHLGFGPEMRHQKLVYDGQYRVA